MAITMTPAALEKARCHMNNRGAGFGIRLGVTTTGCSGLAYVLEFVDNPSIGDEVFDIEGFNIVVDQKSLIYLDGTELDYTRSGLNEGFEFNNPNVTAACGCGESFTV